MILLLKSRLAAVAFCALLACACPARAVPANVRAPAATMPKGEAAAMLAALNRIRAAQGLAALRYDGRVALAASSQAKAMAAARTMSHDVAGAFEKRMDAARLGRIRAVENVAMGYPDVPSVIEGWMASSGHRRNILYPYARRMGVARTGAGANAYWALILASEEEQVPRMPQAAARTAPLPFGMNLFATPSPER